MGAYDRLQPGLFIMRQGDRESKWHGHGPAPEHKGDTAIHAMTMSPFYIIAQLKYTGTGFTKQTSSCRGETSRTHLSPASPIVVYLLCADKCDSPLQSCLGLTFPLCCFDHIACRLGVDHILTYERGVSLFCTTQ